MIDELTPLTKLKLNILTELYQRDLNLVNLEKRTGSLKQTLFKTLLTLEPILDKENGVFSLKKKYKLLLEKVLLKNLLSRRLTKYEIVLNLVKKYFNPKKVILFGSCAKGEMREDSDIDIFIISNVSEEDSIKYGLKFSSSLKKDIQIINVNSEILNSKKNKYLDLYTKINEDIKEGIEVPIDLF